jgi:hypothetical protein
MIQSDITRKFNVFVAEQDVIVGKDSSVENSLELGGGTYSRFDAPGNGNSSGIGGYKGVGTKRYTLGGGSL